MWQVICWRPITRHDKNKLVVRIPVLAKLRLSFHKTDIKDIHVYGKSFYSAWDQKTSHAKQFPWTQDVNWTYLRRAFWTSYVHLVYILCQGWVGQPKTKWQKIIMNIRLFSSIMSEIVKNIRSLSSYITLCICVCNIFNCVKSKID